MDQTVYVAAISAGGAILGASLSQILAMLTSQFERKSKRQEFLREKYELMVDHLNESMKLLSGLEISPLESFDCALLARNAYSLSMIYFPKVHPYSAKFLEKLYILIAAYTDPNKAEEISNLKNEFQKARGEFEGAISYYAKYYT